MVPARRTLRDPDERVDVAGAAEGDEEDVHGSASGRGPEIRVPPRLLQKYPGSWNESGGRTTGTPSPPGCRRLRRWRGKILCGAGFGPGPPANASPPPGHRPSFSFHEPTEFIVHRPRANWEAGIQVFWGSGARQTPIVTAFTPVGGKRCSSLANWLEMWNVS